MFKVLNEMQCLEVNLKIKVERSSGHTDSSKIARVERFNFDCMDKICSHHISHEVNDRINI